MEKLADVVDGWPLRILKALHKRKAQMPCKPTTFFISFYRRGSFIQMTGLDVDAEKDQESLAASAVASEMLDAPTPR